MIYDLKRSVDLRWLFDPVLISSLDYLVNMKSPFVFVFASIFVCIRICLCIFVHVFHVWKCRGERGGEKAIYNPCLPTLQTIHNAHIRTLIIRCKMMRTRPSEGYHRRLWIIKVHRITGNIEYLGSSNSFGSLNVHTFIWNGPGTILYEALTTISK